MAFEPEEEFEMPQWLRIVGKVIKYTFVISVVIMMSWMLLRGCYQNGTKKVTRYLFTEAAAEQYEKGELTIHKLTAYNDNDLGRAFYIDSLTYTEELGQFQFMIRYNRYNESIRTHIDQNGLHSFCFVLVDNLGNRYTEYQYVTDSALMYGYFRLIFEGVDTAPITGLNVYVYPMGEEVDFSARLAACAVWFSDGHSESYTLSGSEKRAERPDSALQSFSVALLEPKETTESEITTGE